MSAFYAFLVGLSLGIASCVMFSKWLLEQLVPDRSSRPKRSAGGPAAMRFSESQSRARPSQLEIFIFWISGVVIMIVSGGVAIYASHFHLWN
jgi:hypothetical protein